WALARQDRNGEAIDFFQESLQVKEKIYESTHRSVAASLTNLSSLLHDESRGEEAEAAARRAVEIFTESIGLQHQHTAHALHNHAKALSLLARHEEATNVARQVISIRREVLPPNHPELAYGISLLAEIMEDLNTDLEEAERLHRESLEIRKGAWDTEHISIASGYEKLGLFLSRQGRFEESEPLIQESLRINRLNYDPDSLSVAVSESFVAGHMCRKPDTLDAGVKLARTSLRKLAKILPDSHYRIGEVNLVIGHCLLEQEELKAAEPFLVKAVDTLRDVHGEEGNRTLAAKAMLKRLNEMREGSKGDDAPS
ncbi:kinesin light chain 3, partial [Exaiptasia diaphana]|uniref:Kinesin light chain n=1 Tax=Exaiptasia diaphana TaxID=2652724 RepID=A0A913XQY0_EXADI